MKQARTHRLVTALAATGTLTAGGIGVLTEPAVAGTGVEPGPDASLLECSSIPSTADPNVLKTVYEVGTGLGASDKVMLAGFEAGWVESHMNNLPCGDRDSLGVFQQRPSQGWGTPEQILNVAFASNSFFTRAIPVAASNPGFTAGQVAQAVQRSAFPSRYDAAEATARALIEQARELARPRPGTTTVGFYRRSDSSWHLTNDNAGPSDAAFVWGAANNGMTPIVGDWNGDGKATVGFYRASDSSWHLTNDNAGPSDAAFVWGAPNNGMVPVVGDWDGDGRTTVGFYRRSDSSWHLTNDNAGPSDAAFVWGAANNGMTPIVGDWNGDGKTTVGFYRASDSSWHLTNDNSGPSDAAFVWGAPNNGMIPVVGDWNGA